MQKVKKNNMNTGFCTKILLNNVYIVMVKDI